MKKYLSSILTLLLLGVSVTAQVVKTIPYRQRFTAVQYFPNDIDTEGTGRILGNDYYINSVLFAFTNVNGKIVVQAEILQQVSGGVTSALVSVTNTFSGIGTTGLVGAVAADAGKFLKSDGTWSSTVTAESDPYLFAWLASNTYVKVEVDPFLFAWLGSNTYVKTESDPFLFSWLGSNTYVKTEVDPYLFAWLSSNTYVKIETDPVWAAESNLYLKVLNEADPWLFEWLSTNAYIKTEVDPDFYAWLGTNFTLSDASFLRAIDWANRYLVSAAGYNTVDWETCALTDSMNSMSIDWIARIAYDLTGAASSMDWANRYLVSDDGDYTVNWQSCMLTDSANIQSIDWLTRIAYDTAVALSVDWQTRLLYDAASAYSVDWATRYLVSNDGDNTVDWQNCLLTDSANVSSVDWLSRTVTDSSNGQSIDWESRILKDSAVANSLDWNNRILSDSAAVDSIGWSTRILSDSGATESADWENRILSDSWTYDSIDWNYRLLYDSSGVQVFDWSAHSLTGDVPWTIEYDATNGNEIVGYDVMDTYVTSRNYIVSGTDGWSLGGGTFTGKVYSTMDQTAYAPASTELPTAGWVRSLALQGQEWYFTATPTNFAGSKTTNFVALSLTPPASAFTNSIPSPVTSDKYLAGGVCTQLFGAVRSPITFEMWLNRVGGNAGTIIPVHPEIYYVYNGVTNHLGDWETANQNVTQTTPTRYTFTVPFTEPTITGSVYIVAYLKSGTVSGAAAGLNIVGGGAYASFMAVSAINAGDTAEDVQANLDAHTNATGTAVHSLGTMSLANSNDYYTASQVTAKNYLTNNVPDPVVNVSMTVYQDTTNSLSFKWWAVSNRWAAVSVIGVQTNVTFVSP